MLPQDAEHMLHQRRFQAAVAGSVPVAGDQPDRPFGPIPDHQALDLSHRQSQPLSGPAWFQITIDHRLNTLQSIQLVH